MDAKLSSIDYAELIRFAAYKYYKTLLNRTQINKILFYVYGVYLAKTDNCLFEDDSPKAWPYGPVFPIVNKKIDVENIPCGFTKEKVELFQADKEAMNIVLDAVKKYHGWTAYRLTEWSHEPDSPWYATLFEGGKQAKWNTEITKEKIKPYFKKLENG